MFIKITNPRGDLRGWVAIVCALAFLAAVAVLTIGLMMVVLPIIFLTPIIYWLLPKSRRAHSLPSQIIDRASTVERETRLPLD